MEGIPGTSIDPQVPPEMRGEEQEEEGRNSSTTAGRAEGLQLETRGRARVRVLVERQSVSMATTVKMVEVQ